MAARQLPSLRPQSEPMDHHARLRQGEAGEHPHRIERDQAVGLGPEDHEDRDGRDHEPDDAVGEDQLVTPVHELPGHETVAGQDRGQARKAGEAGVGRQEQDGHGGYLQGVVEEASSVDGVAYLAEDRVRLPEAITCSTLAQSGDSQQEESQDGGHDAQGERGVLALRRLEGGHGVGDGLGAGHGRAAAGEGPQDDPQQGQSLERIGGATGAARHADRRQASGSRPTTTRPPHRRTKA